MKGDTPCTPELHTEFRSLLGCINWLQSTTQFHIGDRFSRCASASASPTIGDIRALNKVPCSIRARPVRLHFWPIDRSCGQDKQGVALIMATQLPVTETIGTQARKQGSVCSSQNQGTRQGTRKDRWWITSHRKSDEPPCQRLLPSSILSWNVSAHVSSAGVCGWT